MFSYLLHKVSSLYIVSVIMSNKVQLRTMSGEFVARSARQGTKAIRETKLKIVQNPLLTNRSHFLQKKYRYGFLVRQTPLISEHLVLNSLSHINTTRRVGNYLNAV